MKFHSSNQKEEEHKLYSKEMFSWQFVSLQVYKETSPKMAAIDLSKREEQLRVAMTSSRDRVTSSGGGGGDAPLDLSVKKPEKGW